MTWDIGLDIFGSAFYLTSDAIDHAGNFKYGGGLFTTFTTDFEFASLCVGVDYRIAGISVPSSWVDTDNEFVERGMDYIDDLDDVETLSYGINLGIPLFDDSAAINLEAIRSNFYSDDIEDDRDSQTTVALSFSYYPTETFELNFGARQTFELEDIDVLGGYIGAIYRF